MSETSRRNIKKKEVSNERQNSSKCNQINPNGTNLFFPMFYTNYDTQNTKEKYLRIVNHLKQIRSSTMDFIREFVNLLSSDEGKFSLEYHIKVFDKENCEPLYVYPYELLRNIYLQIYEASNDEETVNMKKEKIFKTIYKFLNGYLPIFENDINEFEIQIIHSISLRETVKIFKNDKYEVEMLVYKFLGSLKEIVSAIDYEPVDKKISSIGKEDVLRYLDKGRDLMDCKLRNKYLEEGKKAEPCAENYHALVEGQNREVKPFVEAENVQDEITSLMKTKIDSNSVLPVNGNFHFIGSKGIDQVSHDNKVSYNNKVSHDNKVFRDNQESYDVTIFDIVGWLTLVWGLILLIMYVYKFFKKRRERKKSEQIINLHETP